MQAVGRAGAPQEERLREEEEAAKEEMEQEQLAGGEKCGRTALTKERPRFRKEVDLMLLPQRTVRPSSGLASSGLVTLT